jgi:hypothetical protein
LTLSAKLPVISAGVMIANFSWKRAKIRNGIVAEKSGLGANPTLLNPKKVRGFPIKP